MYENEQQTKDFFGSLKEKRSAELSASEQIAVAILHSDKVQSLLVGWGRAEAFKGLLDEERHRYHNAEKKHSEACALLASAYYVLCNATAAGRRKFKRDIADYLMSVPYGSFYPEDEDTN